MPEPLGQLRAVGAIQLFERVIEMSANGGEADVQQSGDLFIPQAFTDQIDNLLLAGG